MKARRTVDLYFCRDFSGNICYYLRYRGDALGHCTLDADQQDIIYEAISLCEFVLHYRLDPNDLTA